MEIRIHSKMNIYIQNTYLVVVFFDEKIFIHQHNQDSSKIVSDKYCGGDLNALQPLSVQVTLAIT